MRSHFKELEATVVEVKVVLVVVAIPVNRASCLNSQRGGGPSANSSVRHMNRVPRTVPSGPEFNYLLLPPLSQRELNVVQCAGTYLQGVYADDDLEAFTGSMHQHCRRLKYLKIVNSRLIMCEQRMQLNEYNSRRADSAFGGTRLSVRRVQTVRLGAQGLRGRVFECSEIASPSNFNNRCALKARRLRQQRRRQLSCSAPMDTAVHWIRSGSDTAPQWISAAGFDSSNGLVVMQQLFPVLWASNFETVET